ncbi:MAG: peptidase M14 [Gammaproteobacteria bacterium]|nr:peptidase M14 [Gammaproteobacteria bacterium]
MESSDRASNDMGRTQIDKEHEEPSRGAEQSATISAVTTGDSAAEPPVAVRGTLSTAEEASDQDLPTQAGATDSLPEVDLSAVSEQALGKLCEQIGAKLGSVSERDCSAQNLAMTNGWSVQGRPIAFKLFSARGTDAGSLGRVLLIGGIHGDEYSSVSICFRWMEFLERDKTNAFEWLVVPLANPDGLLRKKSQRQNARGVDLNRNFPSRDWDRLALAQWRKRYAQNPRRYPGAHAASEPEVVWLQQQIENFQPDVVIAIHAPYDLLDYDGPPTAPKKVGALSLRQLGVFPGSLGGYAGLDLAIPVVTIELPHAGIMPSQSDIRSMWLDLVEWVHKQVTGFPAVALTPER